MHLEYDRGTLRVQNAEGLRWQVGHAPKPAFTFDYEGLDLSAERALRRLGATAIPLTETEIREVREFIGRLDPPPWATFQRQFALDLRTLARGLVNTVVTRLEYESLLDVMITGRPDSTDLYADEARKVLTYVDSVWNAYYAVAAQLEATPTAELRTFKEYAEQMPLPPPDDHFSGGMLQELLGGPRTNL